MPLFHRGDADRYCFDGDGRIVEWHHDGRELDAVSLSFSEMLMREIAEFEKQKESKVRGGGRIGGRREYGPTRHASPNAQTTSPPAPKALHARRHQSFCNHRRSNRRTLIRPALERGSPR